MISVHSLVSFHHPKRKKRRGKSQLRTSTWAKRMGDRTVKAQRLKPAAKNDLADLASVSQVRASISQGWNSFRFHVTIARLTALYYFNIFNIQPAKDPLSGCLDTKLTMHSHHFCNFTSWMAVRVLWKWLAKENGLEIRYVNKHQKHLKQQDCLLSLDFHSVHFFRTFLYSSSHILKM